MLIVLLVIILLSQYSALPEQQYLPMIQINQYRWPITGFSVMGAFRDKMPIFYAEDSNNPPMWFQDWWLGCEMYSENGTNYGKGLYHASYVPMVYNEWDSFLLRCNDGRQVLVGNEPELISQSNLTPTEMAILLHTVIGQWNGPVYCCGVMVQHTAYMAQVVAEYRRMFGQWPSTVGVHAHLYIVGLDGSPIVTSVNDADIARAKESFDEFMALLEVNNLLHQRIVISECCVLSNILNQDDVVRASYSLINYAMENPSIATVSWFSVYSQGGGVGEFVSSDLVTGNQINDLGRTWLDYVPARR